MRKKRPQNASPKRVPDAIAQAAPPVAHDRSALEMWCAEISHLPLLSCDEERTLALRMLNGDESAREALWHANVRWATELAGRYARHAPQGRAMLDDLSQVASMTLWVVLPDYDWRRGRVTTFVARAIMRDLRRYVDDFGALIRRPVWLMEYERKLRRALDALDAAADAEQQQCITEGDGMPVQARPQAQVQAHVQDGGTQRTYKPSGSWDKVRAVGTQPPTTTARAVMAEELRLLEAQHQPIASLDAPTGGTRRGVSEYSTLADTIPAPASTSSEHEAVTHENALTQQSAGVATFVARYCRDGRDRRILALYYGDTAPYAGNMSAIGTLLGISRQAVNQRHARLLRDLRAADQTTGTLRALAQMNGEG